MMPDYPKTEGDFAYERYETLKEYRPENDIPGDDLLPHDTRITQSLSEGDQDVRSRAVDHQATNEIVNEQDAEQDAYEPLPDVPDADAIQQDSPPDRAAPDPDAIDAMHGTDLLNGYSGDDEPERVLSDEG